jgi:hypothetical protein
MSSLQMVPTSVHRFLKLPQYVEEVTPGTTPNSAVFIDASVINSIRATYANATEMYRKLGSRKMYKYIKMGEDLTWTMSFSPVDTTLIRYGTENGNPTGTLAGTIDKHITMANSRYTNTWTQNGPLIEQFFLRKGSKCDSITVTTTSRGMLVVDMDMISLDVVINQTAPSGGLTTPQWVVSPTTATPWSNLAGGCGNKLTIGGVSYPFKTASFTVNNNLDSLDVDGCDNIVWLEAGAKETTFTAEILAQKDNAIENAMDAGNGLPATLVLNATGPKVATFTNLFINNKTEDQDAGDTSAATYTISGTADDVTVSA